VLMLIVWGCSLRLLFAVSPRVVGGFSAADIEASCCADLEEHIAELETATLSRAIGRCFPVKSTALFCGGTMGAVPGTYQALTAQTARAA
jgi:hypothetical protein